ncbi:uncharacterized protein LOC122307503 [Carya illinoinensis]|uniref:uncharacterized protein LOC122307503 n=1 Tax=Carya illinoinensis TaxID=32201 RepID=UPI001C720DEA|nr:uncharacterized protein LOC122307503 [Carya illinoinensis]
MNAADEEKTSFITDRGLYCYHIMPFGLKNVGATYQRLVNRMFKEYIGKSMEVYVDDLLIKSKELAQHLVDLRMAFGVLCLYKMRLNPSKCAFGIQSGKFLDFIVSERGIETSPDKWWGEWLLWEVAARKLRPYFQAHTVKVLTDAPLTKILRKSDCIKRLIAWSVELSEFDIEYEPRKVIKGQAMMDFVAEFSDFLQEEVIAPSGKLWLLFIDGSSCLIGGGLGIHLLSPDG